MSRVSQRQAWAALTDAAPLPIARDLPETPHRAASVSAGASTGWPAGGPDARQPLSGPRHAPDAPGPGLVLHPSATPRGGDNHE
eukprot:24614-Eustigmatos_ZCMA.PRE.1